MSYSWKKVFFASMMLGILSLGTSFSEERLQAPLREESPLPMPKYPQRQSAIIYGEIEMDQPSTKMTLRDYGSRGISFEGAASLLFHHLDKAFPCLGVDMSLTNICNFGSSSSYLLKGRSSVFTRVQSRNFIIDLGVDFALSGLPKFESKPTVKCGVAF